MGDAVVPVIDRVHAAPMGIPVTAVGRIVFVRWDADPRAEEVPAATDAIVAARRAAGARVILIAIVPAGFKPLPSALLEVLYGVLPTIECVCESQYAVMLGDTFGSAIVRGGAAIFATMLRQPVTVVATVEEAVRAASARLGIDPAAVIAEARAKGALPHV